MKQIEIFDSTLRDGAQCGGINFSVEDKLSIVKLLDGLGISYIEAGNPGSSPKDTEFFSRASKLLLKNAKLVAFGSTRRKDCDAGEDLSLRAILEAGAQTCAVFGKSSLLHVEKVLETTKEENLRMIEDSCRFLSGCGRDVIFDAEHFYDGYRENAEYALLTLSAAVSGGAGTVVLCDTNGGSFPESVLEITKKVREHLPEQTKLGVHFHNDCGLAVANALSGVNAGAVQVQGTYLGFGERCGNTNLSTLIPDLQLKMGLSCIPDEKLSLLTTTAVHIASIANIKLPAEEPYVGSGAFLHKAGMHADGVLKICGSYEHIDPAAVGNKRRLPASEMSGRTVVLQKIQELRPELQKESEKTSEILDVLKELEKEGYQFETADASFELLVRKHTERYHPFFELIDYSVISGKPAEPGCGARATVKLRVGSRVQLMAAEGNGPVNALDSALRSALSLFYPELTQTHLVDYKVRVLDTQSATAARVLVLITSTDGDRIFTTAGVSGDVVEASWKALCDSIEYALLCEK